MWSVEMMEVRGGPDWRAWLVGPHDDAAARPARLGCAGSGGCERHMNDFCMDIIAFIKDSDI